MEGILNVESAETREVSKEINYTGREGQGDELQVRIENNGEEGRNM